MWSDSKETRVTKANDCCRCNHSCKGIQDNCLIKSKTKEEEGNASETLIWGLDAILKKLG